MSRPTNREPRQERSRRSLEAIYAAAIELLTEGGWDAVTIGEIERRSGVTRGTFYLRFESRDALVDYVNDRLTLEIRDLQSETFRDIVSGDPLSIDAASLLAVHAADTVFERIGRLMMHSERLGRLPSTPEAIDELATGLADVLHRAIDRRPQTVPAVEFATQLIFASLVSRRRTEAVFTQHAPLTPDEFSRKLATAVAAYLHAASSGPSIDGETAGDTPSH